MRMQVKISLIVMHTVKSIIPQVKCRERGDKFQRESFFLLSVCVSLRLGSPPRSTACTSCSGVASTRQSFILFRLMSAGTDIPLRALVVNLEAETLSIPLLGCNIGYYMPPFENHRRINQHQLQLHSVLEQWFHYFNVVRMGDGSSVGKQGDNDYLPLFGVFPISSHSVLQGNRLSLSQKLAIY